MVLDGMEFRPVEATGQAIRIDHWMVFHNLITAKTMAARIRLAETIPVEQSIGCPASITSPFSFQDLFVLRLSFKTCALWHVPVLCLTYAIMSAMQDIRLLVSMKRVFLKRRV
jgi:hypothetical protein